MCHVPMGDNLRNVCFGFFTIVQTSQVCVYINRTSNISLNNTVYDATVVHAGHG